MPNAHDAINQAMEAIQEPQHREFKPLSHQELIDLDVPPMAWIMNLLIPNPGLVTFSGKPGSYKTFFAHWLGLRASEGLPLFDEYQEDFFCPTKSDVPMGKVPTLFIEEENAKPLMKERARGFRVKEVTDMFYLIDEGFCFADEAARDALLQIIDERGIKLLILDPFSSVMGLEDENSNAEASKIMDVVRKDFVKRGLTVILIHHPSKGDGDGKNLRGAGDILGKCDVHLCLEVENELEKTIRVSYQKLRVADKSRVANFSMRFAGDSMMRDARFIYLGKTLSKTEEERAELEAQLLEALGEGQEYEQQQIADLVDQKANNKQFVAVWKRLIANKKISRNATTKEFYKTPPKAPAVTD